MSVRASLMSLVSRLTIKKKMATFTDPAEVRDGLGGPPGKLPEEVAVEVIDAGGVPAEWVTWPDSQEGAALLYLHGGGYVFGNLDSHRDIAWRLAKETGMKVLLLDYRLAPEHPFPAAVEDASASYRWLLEQGYAADRIVVGGDSAGGGLTAALMVSMKELGVSLPAASVLISPWADLSLTGESLLANARSDPMLSPEAIDKFATLYMGDGDRRAPTASPVFADLAGLPPTYVMVGSTEVLFSDAETLVNRINDAGGRASLRVWPKMLHVFPVFARLIPEGREAIEDMSAFIRGELGIGG